MSDAIADFFTAWGADAETRRAILDRVMADGFRYADPRAGEALTDRAALATYLDAFTRDAPGWQAEALTVSTVDGLHRVIVAFTGDGPEGTPMIQHGTYFVRMDGDRIAAMTGFAGLGAPA